MTRLSMILLVTTILTACSAENESSSLASSSNLPDYAAHFETASLAKPIELVSCEVGGEDTTCLSVELKNSPRGSYTVGPFCPSKITDTGDQGGIWLQNRSNVVHKVDGHFITKLAKLYNDTGWKMYDPETGEVFHTVGEQCQLAADPNPDPAMANFCVECLVSDLAADLTVSYLIPTTPSNGATATKLVARAGGVSPGLAFSGTLMEVSAPLNLIERNYNIAPFDKCGGHINPNAGYHLHAVTDDCLIEIPNEKGHASQIGIAMDGYPIFERLNKTGEPTDLDQCRGHNSDIATYGLDVDYHYHVNAAGENEILPCLTGQVPQQPGGRAEGGPDAGPGGGTPPDFSEAAKALGLSEEALMNAMRKAGGPQADLTAVAKDLGVSEEDLKAVLPQPPDQ